MFHMDFRRLHTEDKVNMALAIRLLQQMWPEKFSFWPRSWLLPNEIELLSAWLQKHKVRRPSGGAMEA